MRGISIWLEFYHTAIEDLLGVQAVAQALVTQGFVPVEGYVPHWKPVDDLEAYVARRFRDSTQDPPEWRKFYEDLWKVRLIFLLPELEGFTASFDLSFLYYGLNNNALWIHTLVDFGGYSRDERAYVAPVAERLATLGHVLYSLVRPALGWVDEPEGNPTKRANVLKKELQGISWVNFFGQAYVEQYGCDFLLGLPSYRTEVLPDGGVFHQLSPTFVASSEGEAKALRQRVIAYCAQHGLKVTCRAPYVIPGITPLPEPEEPATDAEVREYLRAALATTLVLVDGTRVKPVYIPWDTLTLAQRRMVLEAIREAAISEIKRPGRKRIRFEFNEIPDDLDQMLAGLAGRDNPDFEWVQVKMEG